MRRTSWQDLLSEDADPQAEVASASQDAAASSEQRDIPRSLDDVPELAGLLADRRRLEQELARLTGGGSSGSPDDDRDARRFPILSSRDDPPLRPRGRAVDDLDNRPRSRPEDPDALRDEARDRRRMEARPRTAEERAATRRQAGADRVERSREAWTRHGDELGEFRERAREQALDPERGLDIPGADAADRLLRSARALEAGVERVRRFADETRSGSRRRSRPADDWSKLRDQAREAARFAEDALSGTDAGRRLRALREELAPPDLRDLPNPTRDGDVGDLSELERRRQRALQALRARRDEPAVGSERTARRTAND